MLRGEEHGGGVGGEPRVGQLPIPALMWPSWKARIPQDPDEMTALDPAFITEQLVAPAHIPQKRDSSTFKHSLVYLNSAITNSYRHN